jgi:BlaI family transcriptional regulator, penicillinase repressor
MATGAQPAAISGATPASGTNGERRRSILDLAPFELDCMNALWPLGEATVKQVQESLMARRPRAYTTIMTILDRLAQKGIVSRRKVGRAYMYRASLLAADAQQSAVQQLVAGFFGGSREALAAHLNLAGAPVAVAPRIAKVERIVPVAAKVDEAQLAIVSETEPAAKQSNADSDLDLTLL